MNKTTSSYLDFLRVFAAFGVLITHAEYPWFSTLITNPKHDIGNKLVMVFFVLSGYLISYTVDVKNKGSHQYLIDRFSRLYSVVLPALILTVILDFIGKYNNPTAYIGKMNADHASIRYLLNVTFLAQSWSICTNPGTNGAFWSISYEFWYYIIFWAWIYLKGRIKWVVLILICLLIGLKIIMLLPVWLLGVQAYRFSINPKYYISKSLAGILFVGTTAAIIYVIFISELTFFSNLFPYGKPPIYYSSNFLLNWIYGVLVAVNLYSFNFIGSFSIPGFIDTIIKKLSSVTFSLYLYHVPMLFCAGALIPYDKSNYLQVFGVLALILIVVIILSEITEKQRFRIKGLIEKIFFLFMKEKKTIN